MKPRFIGKRPYDAERSGEERRMDIRQDGRNDTSTGMWEAQVRLRKQIAKLPPEEQEKYWLERERNLVIGRDKPHRRNVKITMPKLNLPKDIE